MPTALERSGDFSQIARCARAARLADRSGDRTAVPRQRHPAGADQPAGRARCSTTIRCRTSPAASASTIRRRCSSDRHQDAAQVRYSQGGFGRNQFFGNLALQRTTTDAGNVFGFTDSTRASGIDSTTNWSHRFSQFLSLRVRYQYTRLTNDVDAVLREPHQRLRRGRHHRQQSGSGQLGRAAAAVRQRRRRPRQRAGGGQQQQHARRRRRDPRIRADATASPSAATSAASAGTSWRSRTRAAASASPAAPPGSISPTSCSASRTRARSPSATPTRTSPRPPTTRTSPTTGASARSLTINAGARWEYEGADRGAAGPARRTST